MDSENNKMFAFLDRYLMGPMGKISQLRIVRGVMAAGMASIPFTIVGSMFLIVSVLPQSFPALEGIWSASFDKIQNLYMLGNTATMGI
ncbi:MAG: PTS cellobiose transporter subunit IIC, partial [Enterococcus casseliflavus]